MFCKFKQKFTDQKPLSLLHVLVIFKHVTTFYKKITIINTIGALYN